MRCSSDDDGGLEALRFGRGRAGSARASALKRAMLSASKRLQLGLASAWLLAQALLPLRHHLHSSDVSWTKLGNEFCWRLMADTTDGWISLEIVVEDAATASPRVFNAHPSSNGGAPSASIAAGRDCSHRPRRS